MPSKDRKLALVDRNQAIDHIVATAFATDERAPLRGQIGLEPEMQVFRPSPEGIARVPLQGEDGLIDALQTTVCGAGSGGRLVALVTEKGTPSFATSTAGRITFEPGGQIELSTRPFPSPAEALEDVRTCLGCIVDGLRAVGLRLAAIGLDIVSDDRESVGLHLDAPRYQAQDTFYGRIGPWGRQMMRHTTSLQVNLDLGPAALVGERWLLANLLSPMLTASFASSPEDGWLSARARGWQRLDPSRCGFPARLAERPTDAAALYAELALDARVMLHKTADGGMIPGDAELVFGRWIEDGHPELGWPTLADLDYHLTTIFPEVRVRGFFELRAPDAVPARHRAALVGWATAALYDDRCRELSLDLLLDQCSRMDDLWGRAGEIGLDDDEIAERSLRLAELALDALGRFPASYLGAADQRAMAGFIDEVLSPRRSIAHRLREIDERSAILAEVAE